MVAKTNSWIQKAPMPKKRRKQSRKKSPVLTANLIKFIGPVKKVLRRISKEIKPGTTRNELAWKIVMSPEINYKISQPSVMAILKHIEERGIFVPKSEAFGARHTAEQKIAIARFFKGFKGKKGALKATTEKFRVTKGTVYRAIEFEEKTGKKKK